MLSATLRDIAIIVVAVQSIVIGVLLAVLIWQIWRLVKIIQTEVRPILEDTQATVRTVRGTATFVSNTVVEPVIRSSTTVTRWRRTFGALGSELRSLRRASPPKTPPPPPAPSSTAPSTPPPPSPGGAI
ncbi:MAG TPA: hypothetical protein VNK95_06870 [Caldilineaceae bacterium]|nr:hypothetical protein [Caldilineaceae bacterium]